MCMLSSGCDPTLRPVPHAPTYIPLPECTDSDQSLVCWQRTVIGKNPLIENTVVGKRFDSVPKSMYTLFQVHRRASGGCRRH